MLGEAALTAEDALRYHEAYAAAMHAIGRSPHRRGVADGPGLSVKLSALHPRYARAQHGRVTRELMPRLEALAALAMHYDVGLAIDAEESDRLDLSLDLFEGLARNPALSSWDRARPRRPGLSQACATGRRLDCSRWHATRVGA